MNFHDAPSNRWFRYDSRCAACYLNHTHTHAEHCAALATARAQEMVQAAPEWQQRGYWERLEEVQRIARVTLLAVTDETPLVDGAWK